MLEVQQPQNNLEINSQKLAMKIVDDGVKTQLSTVNTDEIPNKPNKKIIKKTQNLNIQGETSLEIKKTGCKKKCCKSGEHVEDPKKETK